MSGIVEHHVRREDQLVSKALSYGVRYQIPFHLLHGIGLAVKLLSYPLVEGLENKLLFEEPNYAEVLSLEMLKDVSLSHRFQDNKNANSLLLNLRDILKQGVQENKIQLKRNATTLQKSVQILDRQFYKDYLLPVLSKWCAVFLHTQLDTFFLPKKQLTEVTKEKFFGPKKVFMETFDSVELFLQYPSHAVWETIEDRIPDVPKKLLRLSKDWLHAFLPHVLTLRHDADFGLLPDERVVKEFALPPYYYEVKPKRFENQPFVVAAESRRFLAVPFQGQGNPSPSSEFSDAEVKIGFSYVSYLASGLRYSDLIALLLMLKEAYKNDAGEILSLRKSVKDYVEMVDKSEYGYYRLANVAGFPQKTNKISIPKHIAEEILKENKEDILLQENIKRLWSLGSIDIRDREHTNLLYKVLRFSPKAIEFPFSPLYKQKFSPL